MRGIIPPSTPAAWERKEGQGEGEGYNPPFLSRLVGAEGGRGVGEGVALTPSPSPALRERGELGREIAPAPLVPPFLASCRSGRGARGKVRGIIPPSSLAW